MGWVLQNGDTWWCQINERWSIQWNKNPDDKYEYESDKERNTEKYTSVYAMVVTAQARVGIENNHVVIPVTTDHNNNKLWNNIYKEIDEN